jgi:radical SAM superfamily enzyme YgiQ (UPF0313 family)
MKKILLCTLNSTYQHTSFGLRYIHANMEELADQTEICEWTIQASPRDIVEKILSKNPSIVGFGVYIWNTKQLLDVVSILKKVAPSIPMILGGPEVSYESESQEICRLADYVLQGEADFSFRDLCRHLLSTNPEGTAVEPTAKAVADSSHHFLSGFPKFYRSPLPDIKTLKLPYHLYDENDLKFRHIYVEASRGCPYKCEYCLSSLDKNVRNFPVDQFLQQMESLIQRGARNFKFIDRTFNLSVTISTQILSFFHRYADLGLFLHFEMVPDRLPQELREWIVRFPAGALQFEVGIQTLNPKVAANVSRRNDLQKVQENFQFLTEHTHVHSHADLIVGLPGENLESFAKGFDQLWAWKPDEVQVGILKRLKGTPIARHDREFQMIYSDQAPFQILQNKDVSFQEMQIMSRFAKYWDLIANSGNFTETTKLLYQLSTQAPGKSFFWYFYELSLFLSVRHGEGHSIALQNLVESLWTYFQSEQLLLPAETLAMAKECLIQDYSIRGKRDIPRFLRDSDHISNSQLHKENKNQTSPSATASSSLRQRQTKHLQ